MWLNLSLHKCSCCTISSSSYYTHQPVGQWWKLHTNLLCCMWKWSAIVESDYFIWKMKVSHVLNEDDKKMRAFLIFCHYNCYLSLQNIFPVFISQFSSFDVKFGWYNWYWFSSNGLYWYHGLRLKHTLVCQTQIFCIIWGLEAIQSSHKAQEQQPRTYNTSVEYWGDFKKK